MILDLRLLTVRFQIGLVIMAFLWVMAACVVKPIEDKAPASPVRHISETPTDDRKNTITATVENSTPTIPSATPAPSFKTYPDVLIFTRENGGCKLPCVFGVEVGTTIVSDYKKTLEKQFDLSFDHWQDQHPFPHYATDFPYRGAERIESAATFSFFYTGQVIEGVSVSGQLNRLPYLSINKVMAYGGIPTRAVVDYGIAAPGYGLPKEAVFELTLYFTNPWMMIRYDSVAKKDGDVYTFCSRDLTEQNEVTRLYLITHAFEDTYSFDELGAIFIGPGGHLPNGISIGDALEMPLDNFYKRIMTEEETCFETKIQFWENLWKE